MLLSLLVVAHPSPSQVGYCQGMNFVAGLLLMYLPERHAFGGLVVLMQDRGLRKYYSTDMSLIQVNEGHSKIAGWRRRLVVVSCVRRSA